MSSYTFRQRCRPRGDYRVPQLIEFLGLVKKAFRLSDLYDSKSKPIDVSEAGLWKLFEKETKGRLEFEAAVDFFTLPPRMRDNNTIRIEITTGSRPEDPFIDVFNLSIGDGRKVPDFRYFEKSINIFKPFEAFLAEDENEFRLHSYNRQQGTKFSKPVIIRGFHYLDADMAHSIGGIDYCLNAPAWKVERFCEGVLIRLVPDLFDPDNPEHVRIQDAVMTYFKLY